MADPRSTPRRNETRPPCAAAHLASALATTLLAVPAAAQTANSGLFLNGIDAYGTAAGVGNLVANSTWEAWVRLPSNPIAGSCAVLQRWGWYSHAIWVDAIQRRFAVDMYSCWSPPCPTVNSPPDTLQYEVWHHLALVYGPESGPSCEAYVDGQLVAWCGPQNCVPGNGWQTVLGAWGYTGYSAFLHGAVDEVRISNVPRYSDVFVPQRRFTPDAATVGLWHFDEGAGNVAHDSSGHGRHFTLHGGYQWVPGNTSSVPAFVPFGVGCPGSAGVPVLLAGPGSVPTLGSTFSMRLHDLPSSPFNVPLAFLGYSNTTAFGLPLPLPMSIYGMPQACQQWIDPTAGFTYTLANAGGHADWHLAIPNNPMLHGSSVYVQAIVFDWVLPDPLPAVATNGAELVLGY